MHAFHKRCAESSEEKGNWNTVNENRDNLRWIWAAYKPNWRDHGNADARLWCVREAILWSDKPRAWFVGNSWSTQRPQAIHAHNTDDADHIRLPRIELTTFNDAFEKWLSFYNHFFNGAWKFRFKRIPKIILLKELLRRRSRRNHKLTRVDWRKLRSWITISERSVW